VHGRRQRRAPVAEVGAQTDDTIERLVATPHAPSFGYDGGAVKAKPAARGVAAGTSIVMNFLGLTSGELFIVLFILVAVVSAPLWPRLGAAVYLKLSGVSTRESDEQSKT
jgi:hypothetical protein